MTRAGPKRRHARAAGAAYLLIIVFGIGAELGIRSALIVPEDAGLTAANILAESGRFRAAFAADTAMAICDVALAILLYLLLAPAGRTLALMAAAFRLVQTAVLSANMLNSHAALLILTGAAGAAFDTDERQALALHLVQAHSHGYDLALIFFAFSCALTGILVVRASYLPSLLGWSLVAAGAVYLVGSYLRFLAPDLLALFLPAYAVPLLAELAFALWLLFGPVGGRAVTA